MWTIKTRSSRTVVLGLHLRLEGIEAGYRAHWEAGVFGGRNRIDWIFVRR